MIDEPGIHIVMTSNFAPVQFEGTVDGNPCYFRARHEGWRFSIVKPGENPVWPKSPANVLYSHGGKYGSGPHDASGMPLEEAYRLIDQCVREFRSGKKGERA